MFKIVLRKVYTCCYGTGADTRGTSAHLSHADVELQPHDLLQMNYRQFMLRADGNNINYTLSAVSVHSAQDLSSACMNTLMEVMITANTSGSYIHSFIFMSADERKRGNLNRTAIYYCSAWVSHCTSICHFAACSADALILHVVSHMHVTWPVSPVMYQDGSTSVHSLWLEYVANEFEEVLCVLGEAIVWPVGVVVELHLVGHILLHEGKQCKWQEPVYMALPPSVCL